MSLTTSGSSSRTVRGARPSFDIAPPSFRSEKELVRRAMSDATWSFIKRGNEFGAVNELVTPNGIVDIAVYSLRKDWRSHSIIGDIPSRWAYAFRILPYRRSFSTHDFAMLTGVTVAGARRAIGSFADAGLCEKTTKRGQWVKTRQPYLAMHELISIEAKLSDWRRALTQATRYLDYSDKAWVLMDARKASSAIQNLDEFRARNVGLACISTSGEFQTLFDPSRSTKIREHDRWVVNSELLKTLPSSA